MYNKRAKVWKQECTDKKVLDSHRKNKDNPESQYFIADALLSESSKGKNTAEAVWLMETSAKSGYDRAMLAMGQMFQYGWAVKKSFKTSIKWYEKAAKAGNEEAALALAALKRKNNCNRLAAVATVVVAMIAAVIAVFVFCTAASGVLVNKNTELTKAVTAEEFGNELQQLIEDYDDEQVIAGERSTNRLVLRFEGENLDLTNFLADKVLWQSDNKVIIQFSDETEAQKCLEILKNTSGILYVEEDAYTDTLDIGQTSVTTMEQSYDEQFVSNYSDYTYYSWGVIAMQLDELDAYLVSSGNDNSVIVAVIDSGVVPNSETEDRILDGADFTGISEDGTSALSGHGTHVAGIILNATQGLDVTILPIRVFEYGKAKSSSVINTGIAYAVEQGADVINMSLGGGHSGDRDYEISKAVSEGVTVVVAAGNEASDTSTVCPAHIEDCIVVAANDINYTYASFSNYGDSVTVSAPGVDILSYWKDDSNLENELSLIGETATSIGTNRLDNGIYVEFCNGTSMATPHIAALAAMMKLMNPDASPADIKRYVEEYCIDMGDEQHYGSGISVVGALAGD